VSRLEAPVERPVERNAGGGEGMAEINEIDRHYYEHWIAHTTDEPPSCKNGWSMVLEGFHIGMGLNFEGTEAAYKRRDRKTRLDDVGVFNCTSFFKKHYSKLQTSN